MQQDDQVGICTCLTISLVLLVMPAQIWRASCHRAYDVFVLKTSKRDNAKLVELNGAVSSKEMSGNPEGNTCNCKSTAESQFMLYVQHMPYTGWKTTKYVQSMSAGALRW